MIEEELKSEGQL